MEIKAFECSICLEKLKNPVECNNCHNNFCKEHASKLKECPLCKKNPFAYKDNIWLKRELENIDFCKCKVCNFEGDKNLFFIHLMEKHKTEIIDNFNTNSQKNRESISNKISTIKYDYGLFIGEVKDGIPNGRGKIIYTNELKGDIYEGDFKNGEPEGKGTYYHRNGNIYSGDFKNDKACGKGIFYNKDGSRYEGDWVDDAWHGKGIRYYQNGDRIMGDYYKGSPIGKHVILHANGNVSEKIFN